MKHMSLRQVGDVAVVTPRGSFFGAEETDELDSLLKDLDAKDNRALVLNLIETVHMNSTALAFVTAARARYKKRGGKITLCHLNDRMQTVIAVMRLGELFDDYATEREAVESLKAESKSSP